MVSPPLILVTRVIITQQILSLFMDMVHIFGVITEEFTSIESHRSKTCFLNSTFWRYFSFPVVSFCFNVNQYLFVTLFPIHTYKNISAWPAKYNTYFSLIFVFQDNPQKTPNMDVIIIDTYLNIHHKLEDTETHHTHNQA